MDNQETKTFGELLDSTFQIVKENFSRLFIILLILIGPLFVLNYIIQIVSGTNLITEAGDQATFFQTIVKNIQDSSSQGQPFGQGFQGTKLVSDIVTTVLGIILYPIAHASVVLAVGRILHKETWAPGELIKHAFSRFWPILGSVLLFGLINGAIFFGGIAALSFSVIAVISGSGGGAGTILFSLLLLLIVFAVVAFLATKWSMFFGNVVFKKAAPGLGESFKMTKGHFWATLGFFLVLSLINLVISSVTGLIIGGILGGSVLSTLISNLITLVTTVIFYTGYTVMFFNLRTQRESTDLKEMISTFKGDEDERTTYS